jgi:hypothetical protein
MRLRQILYVLCSFLLASCAFGNQHSYHDTIADIGTSGNITVSVATYDQRPYVLSGQSLPNYVGLQRGGYGNTFNVTTASSKTLAEDMTTSICNSLAARGFKTVAVIIPHSDSKDRVMEKMREQQSKRLLLLSLNEWQSDTYSSTGLVYDVRLEVFDAAGNKLAEKELKGFDHLGDDFWNPPKLAREAVPKAFKEKIEALLNNEDVLKSLR